VLHDDAQLDLALSRFYDRGLSQPDAETSEIVYQEVARIVRAKRPSDRTDEELGDVAQECFMRLYNHRETFTYKGLSHWRAYVHRTAFSQWSETFRKNKANQTLLEDHSPSVEMVFSIGPELVDALAGEAWLGYHARTPLTERRLRLLACQLFHGGASWQEICRLVVPNIDRETLNEWLKDPASSADLAFHSLYFTGPRLVQHILGLRRQPNLAETLADLRSGKRPAEIGPEWSAHAIETVVLRYGYGCSRMKIEKILENRFTTEELKAILVSCEGKLPFSASVSHLTELLGDAAQPILGSKGIWRRLAFEYRYRDELEVADVFERISPQATRASFSLNEGTLNMWLSGNRLIQELGVRMKKRGLEHA
jgi:DNA-directed RNA polymerase specialized sigma24 family protein